MGAGGEKEEDHHFDHGSFFLSSVTFERKTRGNSPRLAHSPSVFKEDSFQNRDWFIINNVHPEYGKEKEEDHFDHGSFFLRPSRS